MPSFVREFLVLRVCKKFWLRPAFIVTALFGRLTISKKGSVIDPLIYTLF